MNGHSHLWQGTVYEFVHAFTLDVPLVGGQGGMNRPRLVRMLQRFEGGNEVTKEEFLVQ